MPFGDHKNPLFTLANETHIYFLGQMKFQRSWGSLPPFFSTAPPKIFTLFSFPPFKSLSFLQQIPIDTLWKYLFLTHLYIFWLLFLSLLCTDSRCVYGCLHVAYLFICICILLLYVESKYSNTWFYFLLYGFVVWVCGFRVLFVSRVFFDVQYLCDICMSLLDSSSGFFMLFTLVLPFRVFGILVLSSGPHCRC